MVERDHLGRTREQWQAGQPRVWALPDAPGDEVAQLRDAKGTVYVREGSKWTSAPDRPGNGWYWHDLLVHRGPLTEVINDN